MGLDMYAYAKDENGEEESLADWRKHNRLHGWMEELWEDKGRPYEGNLDDLNNGGMGEFNCVPVELTLTDLEQLEAVIENNDMPETGGFFFGSDSYTWDSDAESKEEIQDDYYYKETDLQFIEDARKAIEQGKKVYYNSWW
jgi:hypothetical protein